MVRRIAPLVALTVLVCAPIAHAQLTLQEALLRAKPAVVLIDSVVAAEVTLDCGSGPVTVTPPAFRETGTGWFVDQGGWVITNGHVVQPAHTPPRWLVNQQAQRAVTTACRAKALARAGLTPGDNPAQEEAITRKLLYQVLPTTKVKLTPTVSVVLSSGVRLKTEVKKYTPPVSPEPGIVSGRDLALLRVPGEGYPVLLLADSRTVQIGDSLQIIGFPGVVLTHELLKASVEASFTRGGVSGFQKDVAGQPMIQTDAPASWGNSGGPAVTSKGEVLGVLTFVSMTPGAEGSIVQGFNFVIPSHAVREFLTDTEVKLDGKSRFNDVWFRALRAYYSEDWAGAVKLFQETDRVIPKLPDVKRMLDEAQEKLKNPPPRPFPWFWVAIAVTVLSAGGYGLQFFLSWQKNRYRVQPSEVIRLMESGKDPIVVDARKSDAYEKLPLRIPHSLRLAPEELASGLSGLELDTTRPVVAYCT